MTLLTRRGFLTSGIAVAASTLAPLPAVAAVPVGIRAPRRAAAARYGAGYLQGGYR